MHIEMGDVGRYNVTEIGTTTFQRELGSPLKLKDVMLVSSLKNNIVSVPILEDHGYDVIFSHGTSEVNWGLSEELVQVRCGGLCCIEHKGREGEEP